MGRETVLKAIRNAENKAKETISDAESQASEIITKARLAKNGNNPVRKV